MTQKKKGGEIKTIKPLMDPLTDPATAGIRRQIQVQIRRLQQGDGVEKTGPKQTKHKCATPRCKGRLVEDICHEFDPTSGPPIIGPGSRSQFNRVSRGFYCNTCGVKYQFPPKKK